MDAHASVVGSPAPPVNAGTVTFTLYSPNGAPITTTTSGIVRDGQVTGILKVPAAEPAGEGYYVVAVYNGGATSTDTWRPSSSPRSNFNIVQPFAISGGSTTEIGDRRIVTFTASGNATITGNATVQLLVVGGGGSGGTSNSGGGGGGGVVYHPAFSIHAGIYPVTIGAGAAGGTGGQDVDGDSGDNSSFGTVTAIGGGAGSAMNNGSAGGSGGGGGGAENAIPAKTIGGAATTGQGHSGGGGEGSGMSAIRAGGGGGGAGSTGSDGTIERNTKFARGGHGGNGLLVSITGSPVMYGGGGGGAAQSDPGTANGGIGGNGGGGNGGYADHYGHKFKAASNGTNGLGGGGGGGHRWLSGNLPGGAGGSGVVIIGYTTAAPTLSFIRPVPIISGSSLLLSGTQFMPGATVTIGGATAMNVTVVSSSLITCDAPSLPPGDYYAQVENSNSELSNALLVVHAIPPRETHSASAKR